MGTQAFADEEPRRLADYTFSNESWSIRPVIEPDVGVVSAIVAVAKPDAVIGDNLNVVMFIRDGNQWEAWSWANATRVRGIYSAKCILNISDEDDAKWELDEPLPWAGEDPVRPPTPYMAGMLTDDPLFEPVMNSSNPAALVEMLAAFGYPVATAGRPLGEGAETNCVGEEVTVPVLMAMAGGVEWGLTQPQETMSDLVAMSESIVGQLQLVCAQTGPSCPPSQTSLSGETKKCIWKTLPPTIQHGQLEWCNYRAQVAFVQSEYWTTVTANCSTTRCNRSRTGTLDGDPVNCIPSLTPSNISYCPSNPTCASVPPTQTICDTKSTDPAIAWSAWSRVCP